MAQVSIQVTIWAFPQIRRGGKEAGGEVEYGKIHRCICKACPDDVLGPFLLRAGPDVSDKGRQLGGIDQAVLVVVRRGEDRIQQRVAGQDARLIQEELLEVALCLRIAK